MVGALRLALAGLLLALLTGCPPRPAQGEGVSVVKLSEIVADPAWVGKTVRVSGVCRGYGGEPSPPPVSRSDWVLESEGARVYVVGPLPGGCDPVQGGPQALTLTATVREYALPALGNQPPPRRAYLELAQNP